LRHIIREVSKMRPKSIVHPNRAMMAAFALSQVTRESGGRQAVVAASLEDETTKALYIKNETTISLEHETTMSISLEDETTKAVSLEDETTEFLPPQIDEPSPRLPEELLPTKEPSQPYTGPFRLRLYWEKGYKWQNNREEKWYCTGKFRWALFAHAKLLKM